ncbi:unnamed protein product [Sphenostylis stenocarpa]|uniref:Uncharacterized protein n=1 Tax=Sphenostylis stenocarpa TaxID=92480 RepID=A0AA86VHD9_9FABA|nr:unnamed protein product [Sphenostylis stenocarpa]
MKIQVGRAYQSSYDESILQDHKFAEIQKIKELTPLNADISKPLILAYAKLYIRE